MFNCSYISAGQASTYYKVDDYYTSKGSVTARVGGAAAKRLGLTGEYQNAKFQLALKGKFEFNGKPVFGADNKAPDPKRAAFDCVFSAPKSCSIDALVHDNSLTREAHIKAVEAGMKFVEELIRARVTADLETSKVKADIVYFSFDHETSRNVAGEVPDPDLHTHSVIPTQVLVRNEKGVEKMYALDNSLVLKAQKCADHVYKQAFASELRAQGREVILTKDGFELTESLEGRPYTRDRIEASSKRSMGIVKALEAIGLTRDTASSDLKEFFNLKNRHAKKEIPRPIMKAMWKKEDDAFYAAHLKIEVAENENRRNELGDGKSDPLNVVRQVNGNREGRPTVDGVIDAALAHHGQREVAFKQKTDIYAYCMQAAEYDFSLEEIKVATEKAITDGRLILGRNGQALIMRQAWEDEQAIEASYKGGLSAVAPVTTHESALSAISEMESNMTDRRIAEMEISEGRALFQNEIEALAVKLTDKQSAMVVKIATSPDRISVILGDAGTGKSTGMEGCRIALELAGYRVLGLAPSGTSVNALDEAITNTNALERAGVNTKTVQHAFHNPQYWDQVDEMTVIILDEAGLVDIQTMRLILNKVAEKGARLAVVGDPKQYGSVNRGAAMKQLCTMAEKAGVMVNLDQMQRGRNEFMREFHLAARDDPMSALDMLADKGMVTCLADEPARLDFIAQRYCAMDEFDRKSGGVIVETNADRRKVSQAIRTRLGLRDSIAIKSLEISDLSVEGTKLLQNYGIGDTIRLNRKLDGWKAGAMLKVLGKMPRSILVQFPDSTTREIHPSEFRGSVSVGRIEDIDIAPGDRIRFTAADKIQEVVNGDRGEVTKIVDGQAYVLLDRTKETVTVAINGQGPVQIRHAYAFTGHSFQGGTARMKLGKDGVTLNTNANVIYYLNKSDRNAFYTIGTRPADKMHVVMAISTAREIEQVRKCITRSNEKDTAEKLLTGEMDKPAEHIAYLAQATGAQIWKRIDLPKDATPGKIAELLKLAQAQYGNDLFIAGPKPLQKTVAQIAGWESMDIKFDDQTIDGYRSKAREKVHGKVVFADGDTLADGKSPSHGAEQHANVISLEDWKNRKGYAEHQVRKLEPAYQAIPEIIRFFKGTYPSALFTVQRITNPGSRNEVRQVLFDNQDRELAVTHFNKLLAARGVKGQEAIQQIESKMGAIESIADADDELNVGMGMRVPLKEQKSFAQMLKDDSARNAKVETGVNPNAAPVENYQVILDESE